MKTSKRLKIWEISLLLALCAAMLLGLWAEARQARLSSQLVRLHVIAASDDAVEQAVKLDVRDEVIEYLTPQLAAAGDSAAARDIIAGDLQSIEKAAAGAAGGREVRVTLSEELYPTREYESFTLPAGRYESLRVIIGEGEGKNWWCVVFPPLCLTAASEKAREAMSEDDYSIISNQDGYVLRFKIIDLWGRLIDLFE